MGEVQLKGQAVTVRQLTVREVNEYLEGKAEPPTMAELLLNRPLPEKAVRLATGLTSEELNGDVLPSELVALWDEVEEVNPFLADLSRRLMTAGRELVEAARSSAEGSSAAAPARLPDGTDTPA